MIKTFVVVLGTLFVQSARGNAVTDAFEYALADTTCANPPRYFTRTSATCPNQYDNLCTVAGNPSTAYKRYKCTSSMSDPLNVTLGAKYLGMALKSGASCGGPPSAMMGYLADNTCREAGDKYFQASCDVNGSYMLKQCYNNACTNCSLVMRGIDSTCTYPYFFKCFTPSSNAAAMSSLANSTVPQTPPPITSSFSEAVSYPPTDLGCSSTPGVIVRTTLTNTCSSASNVNCRNVNNVSNDIIANSKSTCISTLTDATPGMNGLYVGLTTAGGSTPTCDGKLFGVIMIKADDKCYYNVISSDTETKIMYKATCSVNGDIDVKSCDASCSNCSSFISGKDGSCDRAYRMKCFDGAKVADALNDRQAKTNVATVLSPTFTILILVWISGLF